MHLTVAKVGGEENVFTIEISSDLSLKDLKVIIEAESDFGINAEQMILLYEGQILDDDHRTLAECHFHDYDLLTCQKRILMENVPTGERNRLNSNDPRQLFEMFRSNRQMMERIERTSPQTAEAIRSGNFNRFLELLSAESSSTREQNELNHLANLDPFDPDVQRRIHEMITMQNVQENMEHAVEHAPEVFGHVTMLYINCKVNGHQVKAFVDSGAQMTIMSQNCAERCGIMRLVDRRFSGIAKGVGTQTILGRIHLAQLEIEKHYFATSLSVLEDQPMDMLLGLDMLKRHQVRRLPFFIEFSQRILQCIIDLQENVLRFGNTVQTTFLSESELPTHAKLSTDSHQDHSSPSVDQNQANNRRATTTTTTSSSFSDELIQEITKNGFTREQAIDELKLTNGDSKKALVSLMAKSLSMPKRKR